MASFREIPSLTGPVRHQACIRREGKNQFKTFRLLSDAEKWARDIESSIEKAVFVDTKQARKLTLFDALEDYRAVSLKKDGAAQEEVRINSWQRDPLAKKSLAAITGKDLTDWKNARLKVVKPSTVQKDLAIISHIYTTAREEWHIAIANPIEDMSMPTVSNSRERCIEGDEELRLLRALDPRFAGRSPWIIPLVQLALETCARQSELLALKWSDVNTDEKVREIHLRGKERADGEERTKTTKKGASAVPKTRKVPLSRQAMAVLDDLRKTRDNNDERVLPVSSQVVKHAYADACRRSGISGLTFHDLRHTAITRMAAKVPMEKLMKITGHRTSAMLVRYYHPKMIELAQLLD